MLKPIRSRLAALLAGSLLFGAVAARAGDIPSDQPTVFVITGRNITAERFCELLTA